MTENWLHIPGCFPGISYAEASIGQVVTSPAYRGTGAGRQLMQKVSYIRCASSIAPRSVLAPIVPEPILPVAGIPRRGFQYLEDGIPAHRDDSSK